MSGIADQTNHRCDVNNATAPLLDHRPHNRLREIERAAQVRVDHRVPIFDRHAHGESVPRHAGVVHQNVDLAEVFENLRADFLHSGMIRDIDRIIFRRIRTRRIDFIRGPFRVRLRAAHRGDTRAFVRKPQCDRVPNPPPRAGHDRGLIFKSHVSSATRAVFCRAAKYWSPSF